MRVALTLKSKNKKTGPIPVSISSSDTCPPSCGLYNECYAKIGPLAIHWRKVSDSERGMEWNEFLLKIKALPKLQLWRHNQAGDLPGKGETLSVKKLASLVVANKGKIGFTYTHKPLLRKIERNAIKFANANGFTVNLSADSLTEADKKASLGIGPVVVVLPSTQTTNTITPEGRNVVICPAYTHGLSCDECRLCYRTQRAIVGFPAHGVKFKAVDKRIALELV